MNRIKYFVPILYIVAAASLACSFLACETEFSRGAFFEEESKSIYEYVESKADTFSRFRQVIDAGELDNTLRAYNPNGNDYTLFLPTNDAFDSFFSRSQNYGGMDELLNDQDYTRALVRYHTVNMALQKSDFPFGALPDTTLSGDLLTIGYTEDVDSTIVKVNNFASILSHDIEMANGYIHIIDEVLEPVVFSSYEWLEQHPGYSLFKEALDLTGLKDTFKIQEGSSGFRYPRNTLLVESDEVFHAHGIHSIGDLKERYSPEQTNYSSYSNGLYQFMAYHIIEGKQFLNSFEGKNTNYNTYASLPLSINATGIDIKINAGVDVFDTLVTNNDTTIINYVGMEYDQSNVITQNGAIHFISHVMDLFSPGQKLQVFQFYEDPLINAAEKTPDTYIFDDPNELEVIDWQGIEDIVYVKSPGGLSGVNNNDYLEMEGDFLISYEIPKILPGRYLLQIRANDENNINAIIQIHFDGKRIGGNVDLTANPNSGGSMYNFDIGQVELFSYEKHLITIRTLIPGRFTWDLVRFEPIEN